MAKLLERDWYYLRAGAEDLERYLLSPELYWPLTGVMGKEGMLQFTLGNLELSQARLRAVAWPAQEQAELDGLDEKIATVHAQWKANWARKAAHEQAARLKLWQGYLDDLLHEPGRHWSGYAFEVRLRTILDLLNNDTGGLQPPDQSLLSSLDTRLRASTIPGPFVWEPEVQPGFPQETFWYLYVTYKK